MIRLPPALVTIPNVPAPGSKEGTLHAGVFVMLSAS
jgi:hypothetical protein